MNRTQATGDQESDPWLIHQWVVAGVVSASARFIPIPFVDDLVQEQCRRFVVASTFAAYDSPIELATSKPYYGSPGGCVSGCSTFVLRAPFKLLLFPLRKIWALVTSIRGVPLEILRMVLLGRTLDRLLRSGRVEDHSEFFARLRQAFDVSFARMDFRVVRATMHDALAGVSGWRAAAVEAAKQLARPDDAAKPDLAASQELNTSANRIQDVLDRPETAKLFSEFDSRLDRELNHLG